MEKKTKKITVWVVMESHGYQGDSFVTAFVGEYDDIPEKYRNGYRYDIKDVEREIEV